MFSTLTITLDSLVNDIIVAMRSKQSILKVFFKIFLVTSIINNR